MDIDRRGLLKAGCLGLTELAVLPRIPSSAVVDLSNFQPMTKLLLERAQRAGACTGPVDVSGIEELTCKEALAQGWPKPPVIKWLAEPSEAFDFLSQFGLHQLLQIDNARLWRRASPQVHIDDDRLNSAAVLGSRIAGLIRSAEHDNALMAPKLLSKAQVMAENASAEAVFKVRAVAAQIGWLETCIPVVAAQAVTDVEVLLSASVSEETINHRLRVFEAYELGLLATWETTDLVICVPRTHPVFRLQGEWDDLRPFRPKRYLIPAQRKSMCGRLRVGKKNLHLASLRYRWGSHQLPHAGKRELPSAPPLFA